MTASRKSLYEVLGVGRRAKLNDIERAYARLRAEMQKENAAPDRRLAAMAKVAYETLSDPARREEYDETLGSDPSAPRSRAATVAGAFALAAIAAAAYYYFVHRPATVTPGGEKIMSVAELLEEVGPRVGKLQGALVSGEVRDIGMAVEVGEHEMASTCEGILPGMTVKIVQGNLTPKTQLVKVNEELDLCLFEVRGANAGLKVRQGVPGTQEKLQAVIVGNGAPEARQVTIARGIADARGAIYELKAGAALPNGTPVFDMQARLVGLVASPSPVKDAAVVALGASRIEMARGSSAAPARTASAAPATRPVDPAPAPAEAPARAPAPPPQRAAAGAPSGLGTLEAEGFTTLWKENHQGHLIKVMDDVQKGGIGLPLAYWTQWSGRPDRGYQTHCRVTYGPEQDLVADYDQVPGGGGDGYWYCALTRFQVELDDLPAGEYHFTIFVDGRPVAERSIRMEARLITPTRLAALVLVVGVGLLAFLRRNKVVKL